MAIFGKLFRIFDKYGKVPHQFRKSYEEISVLSELLKDALAAWKDRQERLVGQLEAKKLRFAGHSGLAKTMVIRDKMDALHRKEEGIIPELKKLANKARKRFEAAEKSFEKDINPTKVEELEIARVRSLLSKILDITEMLRKEFEKAGTSQRKLEIITDYLKEISELAKKYYHEEEELEKRVLEDYKSINIVDRVYSHCRNHHFCPNKHEIRQINPPKKCPVCGAEVKNILEYEMSRAKIKEFERQAEILNAHHDPDNKVIWRRWWREKQAPEKDVGTGYGKLHVNVDVRLRGRRKKSIHLVAA